jgi:hypothetical protein
MAAMTRFQVCSTSMAPSKKALSARKIACDSAPTPYCSTISLAVCKTSISSIEPAPSRMAMLNSPPRRLLQRDEVSMTSGACAFSGLPFSLTGNDHPPRIPDLSGLVSSTVASSKNQLEASRYPGVYRLSTSGQTGRFSVSHARTASASTRSMRRKSAILALTSARWADASERAALQDL